MGLNNILKMITPRALMFGSMKKFINPLCVATPQRNFGILQEYNERRQKKLTNNILTTDRNMHWVTSSRPSNFGDPLDVKTKVDNWFDENRAGTKRTEITTSDVPRSTWPRDSLSAHTSSESRLSSPLCTARCSPPTDTSETPTRKLMSAICPLVKSSRLLGTDNSFSSEDSPSLRLPRPGPSPRLPNSIKSPPSRSQMPETPPS